MGWRKMHLLAGVGLLLPVTVSSAAPQAQLPASAGQVAQQLAKLEEDMNADPNTRLAAFDAAVRSKSAAIRQKAIALAFASPDATLKTMALRHRVCEMQNITVMHGFVSGEMRFEWLKARRLGLIVSRCDPDTGRFKVLASDARLTSEEYMGNGSINRRSIQVEFRPANYEMRCYLSAELDKDQDMSGTLSCVLGSSTFGPVTAAFYL